jgi:hypothetical protein
MLTLSEIEVKVNELAQTIGAPQNWLPTYGYSEQTARPHVEVSPLAYYYVVTQSGQEISRYATQANKIAHKKYPYPNKPKG